MEENESTEKEECPACDSSEFENHYEGTFTPGGRICLMCGYVVEAPHLEGSKIGIKSWRRAWYEKAFEKTGILPLTIYLYEKVEDSRQAVR